MSHALISMLARGSTSVFVFDCGTQHREVKRCVRFYDVVVMFCVLCWQH